MVSLSSFVPIDRLQALAKGEELPDPTTGAALCADISGFTPLTETLLRELGARAGAEELTRRLNAAYGTLIAEVHRYRGAVVSFSGDAITCWFDQDDGLRAVAGALAMQQVISRFSQASDASEMPLPLSVKAGVSTGPVRRLRVGNPQEQCLDVLAGKTMDRLEESLRFAKKGEVVVSEETIPQIVRRAMIDEWRTSTESNRRFAVVTGLFDTVEATPWPPCPELTEEQISSWILPPVYDRVKIGPDRFLAELRPSVALFLKFDGIDYDEDVRAGEKLDQFVRWVQSILARHEGYLLQLMTGDKGSYLYATFGVPRAHDDDELRTVAAGVELLSPPGGIGFVSNIQIGISKGLTWAGAYGGPTRRTYGVLGNDVNIAARLMQLAKPGQILVRDRVANAAKSRFHFQNLTPVRLKGVTEPLTPFAWRDRWIQTPKFNAPSIGRDGEIARLEQVLSHARDRGEGQIAVLSGEAGIGKSHLRAELCEWAIGQGWKVALGVCETTSRGIAYSPWRQAFRALFDVADEPFAGEELLAWEERQVAHIQTAIGNRNPDWLLRLPLLRDLLGLPFPDNATTASFAPAMRQQAMFSLAADMVQQTAQDCPALLVIEDIHWMDGASKELTLALARTVAHIPAVLLLLQRPQDTSLQSELDHLNNVVRLDLPALRSPAVEELVLRHLQSQPAAAAFSIGRHRTEIKAADLAISLIQARAEGNPFFAGELTDALCESGDLHLRSDGTWTISDSLLDALRNGDCVTEKNGERLLKPDVPLPVGMGIPDSVSRAVLARIDHLPEEYTLTLKTASIIGHSFEIDLLAEAHPHRPPGDTILNQLRDMETRNLVLPGTPSSRRVFTFQHNIIRDVVYASLPDTQQHELHQAVGEALENLEPDAIEKLAYHYRYSLVREKALLYLGRAARKTQREYANKMALYYYNEALKLEERWELRKGQIEVLHILGRRDEERAALEGLESIPETDTFVTACLWAEYYEATGQYLKAQSAIAQAARACQASSRTVDSARCLAQLGSIVRRQGDYERAKESFTQALELLQGEDADPDEEAQVLNSLGIVCRQQSQYDEARACHQRALTLSRQSGNRVVQAQALNDLGTNVLYQRDFTGALDYYRQSLETRRAIGDRGGEADSLYNMALATRDAGDYGETQRLLSEAFAIYQVTGNRWAEINAWNELGLLYFIFGDLPQAQVCLEQGRQLSQEIGANVLQAYILSSLGQVISEQGDHAMAESLLLEGLSLAREKEEKHLASYFYSYLGTVSLMAERFEQASDWAAKALSERGDDQRLLTSADLTTIAVANQALGHPREALDYAERCLALLDECEGQGPEYPQRDCFLCYQVFLANNRDEQARSALQFAYDQVMARANNISDPDLRESFLGKVRINAAIVEEHQGRKSQWY